MDSNRDHPIPNTDPKENRRGNNPNDSSRDYGRFERKNAPSINHELNKNGNQLQQPWQAPKEDNQPLTNQDEQRKIANTDSDNALGET